METVTVDDEEEEEMDEITDPQVYDTMVARRQERRLRQLLEQMEVQSARMS